MWSMLGKYGRQKHNISTISGKRHLEINASAVGRGEQQGYTQNIFIPGF